MTTRVRITNEGPGRLMVSATTDNDREPANQQVLAPGQSEEFRSVWKGTYIRVEEVDEASSGS